MNFTDELLMINDENESIERILEDHVTTTSFVLGVMSVYNIKGTDNVAVIGNIRGKVHIGDTVFVADFDDPEGPSLSTKVIGLERGVGNKVTSAEDCRIRIYLENAQKQNIRCGTVLFTRDISITEVYKAYCFSLAETYIFQRNLELKNYELDDLSISACTELIRQFNMLYPKNMAKSQDELISNEKKINMLREALCEKLITSEKLYCVMSKATGYPYLFSKTSCDARGIYSCTPPDIMLMTKEFADAYGNRYKNDKYDIKEIVKGEDEKGIENFLGSQFYMNGACGTFINTEGVIINAQSLVEKPDFRSLPETSRPVLNPDLTRWLLLMGQFGTSKNPDDILINNVYASIMERILPKTKFIVPMRHKGEKDKPEGEVTLQKDTVITIAITNGRDGRDAVKMYTDWDKLNKGMGEGWDGMICSIEDYIDRFDVAINVIPDRSIGIYVNQQTYRNIVNIK